MKRKTLTGPTLILTIGLFVIFSGCNSGTRNQSEADSMDSDPIATSELIQGVFELVPPYQGYTIYLDNYFILCYGMSDSTMIGTGGKYEIMGDTITDYFNYKTIPNIPDTKWTAEKLGGDTVKITMFNPDGSIMDIANVVKKVNPTEEIRNQMKHYEGFSEYLPPLQGLGANLAGYYIYLFGQSDSTMIADAGTYDNRADTFTCKYQFSTDPQLIGGELKWIDLSIVGDTFSYAVLNETGEGSTTFQSVIVK